jgi:hypothetical protein
MSFAPRKAMLVGVTRPLARVSSLRFGSRSVGPVVSARAMLPAPPWKPVELNRPVEAVQQLFIVLRGHAGMFGGESPLV